jgi:heat-inducible transcriptional repressor
MKKTEIRQQRLLKALVEEYIEHIEPVSSQLISDKHIPEASPATIRLDMAKLEEKNLIFQQHTSAGRVPTISGYRAYLSLIEPELEKLNYENTDLIRNILVQYYRDTPMALHYIMQLLARETDELSFVAEPEVSYGYLNKLDVFKISENKLLFVVSLDSGLDKTVILNTDTQISEYQLRTIVRYVNDDLIGRRIYDIQHKYLEEIFEKVTEENKLLKLFLDEFHKALIRISNYFIHFDGNINFLEQPEFDDKRAILSFLGFIQRQDHLVGLMQKETEKKPYHYLLGEELGRTDMANYSMVFAKYEIFGVPGYLGILAPARMNYRKHIPIIRDFAKTITNTTNKGVVLHEKQK